MGALFAQRLRGGSRSGRQKLEQLRNAQSALFVIFKTPEEGIGIPISMNGLSNGYDKLP